MNTLYTINPLHNKRSCCAASVTDSRTPVFPHFQLVEECGQDSGTGAAEGVSEGDGTAEGVYGGVL